MPVVGVGNGIIAMPTNVTVVTLPDEFERGYIQSWNLSVQRELKWGFTGEVAYVATRQIRALGFTELNWSPVGGGQAGRQLNTTAFRRTAQTQLVSPVGNSHYDAMQVRIDRRFRDFFQLSFNYTWSKSMTTAGIQDSDGAPRINIPQFFHLNRTLSNFDRTHNVQIRTSSSCRTARVAGGSVTAVCCRGLWAAGRSTTSSASSAAHPLA